MAILIRTSDVPPAQRHDAWRSVVCDTLGPPHGTTGQVFSLAGRLI